MRLCERLLLNLKKFRMAVNNKANRILSDNILLAIRILTSLKIKPAGIDPREF